jgi:hypothetical protein
MRLKYKGRTNTDLTLGPNYHIIGVYDKEQKIWYNAWSLIGYPINSFDLYKKSKDLLLYALNIPKDMHGVKDSEKLIIMSILINSKFYITERRTQLDVVLAIITYLTKAKNYYYIPKDDLRFYIIETS